MLAVEHVSIATVDYMRSTKECWKVENITEAVDDIEICVIPITSFDTLETEADVFE